MNTEYDIAVLGGGLAGLSVIYHLLRAGRLQGKRVLLVDPEGRKSAHDRTWSYWEKEDGEFDHLVHKKWETISVHNFDRDVSCPLGKYTYKLIRSSDFYAFVNSAIDESGCVDRERGRALAITPERHSVCFAVNGRAYRVGVAFSSLPMHLRPRQISQPYLDQHFRGWFIRTPEDRFDPDSATLMDFRTPQEHETRFLYVLPFTPRRAMVEVAIFSNDHLQTEEYDRIIATYLERVWGLAEYEIEHREAGNIPMTTYPFPRQDGNLIYIGLRGGAARPSTGYTFYGLQRQLRGLAESFPNVPKVWRDRDVLYDATILNILQNRKLAGSDLFVDLFHRNPPERLLSFLNGETNLGQEIALMSTTNMPKFGKAFLQELNGLSKRGAAAGAE